MARRDRIRPSHLLTSLAMFTAVAAALAWAAPGRARGGVTTSAPIVVVSPLPGSRTAPPATQISLVGAPASQIGAVTVTGSQSGPHAGRLEAYSQGDGASFVSAAPFTPGEHVTVKTGLRVAGATGGQWSFDVAIPASSASPGDPVHAGQPRPTTAVAQVSHYLSDPSLQPPTMNVDVPASGVAPGDIFMGVRGPTPQVGPLIADNHGYVVWFDPSAGPVLNFREQQYLGHPVLTWWHGTVVSGHGEGSYELMNSSYQKIADVSAGNGLSGDLHEFILQPNGTALLTAYEPIRWDLTSVGGSATGEVDDGVAQEIDVKTGLVRYQWDSLDRVNVARSYVKPGSATYDYFHINSIQPYGQDLIISSRNTHAVYEVDKSTGRVVWRLGGNHSSFTMGPGSSFAWQHDAEMHAGNLISIYDNEAAPNVAPPSRGIILRLDTTAMTATLVHQYVRKPGLTTGSQGNVQELPNGDVFVGWGGGPVKTEFTASGVENFELKLPNGVGTYRGFRFRWTGTPTTKPALAVHVVSGSSSGTAYMSWNGATEVSSWEVLGGPSTSAMSTVATVKRHGFETATNVPAEAFYKVQALNSSGSVLGTSPVTGSTNQPTAGGLAPLPVTHSSS